MSTGIIKGTKSKKNAKKPLFTGEGKKNLRKEIDPTTDVNPKRNLHDQNMMDNCDTIECD